MRRVASIATVLALMGLGAIVGLTIALTYPLPPPPSPSPPNDNGLYYGIKVILSVTNITLLIVILYVYAKIFSEIRSKVTVGQILVASSLLAYAVTSNPALQLSFGFHAEGLGPFAMMPDLFAMAALAILLEMSLE